MGVETLFIKDDWVFGLTVPPYEKHIFGRDLAELRLVNNAPQEPVYCCDDIKSFLQVQDIMACTFRGQEQTSVVRYLELLGFLFVGTYSAVKCRDRDFTGELVYNDLQVVRALEEDYAEMISIKGLIYDYSTHQIDPSFDKATTSYRNTMRLRSYFSNPDHRAYVVRFEGGVIGYLQFVVDLERRTALCTNGCVDPLYHNLFIGAKLYSCAFKDVFEQGIKVITSGYCNQNMPAMKLHQACGFRVYEHEIHLRLHT